MAEIVRRIPRAHRRQARPIRATIGGSRVEKLCESNPIQPPNSRTLRSFSERLPAVCRDPPNVWRPLPNGSPSGWPLCSRWRRPATVGRGVFRNACRHRGMALVEGPGCFPRVGVPLSRLDVSRRRARSRHVPPRRGPFPDLGHCPPGGWCRSTSREVDGPHRHRPAGGSGDGFAAGQRADARDGGPDRRQPRGATSCYRPSGFLYAESTARRMNWKVLVEQFP